MYVKDIKEACRRVISGDEEALKQLGLDNASYPVPKPQSTLTISLQASYDGVLNTTVAARELQLSFLKKQCELTLQYMQAIAAAKNISLKQEVDPQDVTEVMLAFIDEEKEKYKLKHAAAELSQSEEEEDEETPQSEEREADNTKKEDGKVQVEKEMETQSKEKEQRPQPKKRKAVTQIEEDSECEEEGDEETPESKEKKAASQIEEETEVEEGKRD